MRPEEKAYLKQIFDGLQSKQIKEENAINFLNNFLEVNQNQNDQTYDIPTAARGYNPNQSQQGRNSATFARGPNPNQSQQGRNSATFARGPNPNLSQQGRNSATAACGYNPNRIEQGRNSATFARGPNPNPSQQGRNSATFARGPNPDQNQQGSNSATFARGPNPNPSQQGRNSATFARGPNPNQNQQGRNSVLISSGYNPFLDQPGKSSVKLPSLTSFTINLKPCILGRPLINQKASLGFIPNEFSPIFTSSAVSPGRQNPEVGREYNDGPACNRPRRVSTTDPGQPLCASSFDETKLGKRDLSKLYLLPNNQKYVFPGNKTYFLPPDHAGGTKEPSKASTKEYRVNDTDLSNILGDDACAPITTDKLPENVKFPNRNLVQTYTLPNNERYIFPRNYSYSLPNNGEVVNTTGASNEEYAVNPIDLTNILGDMDSPCDSCPRPNAASTPIMNRSFNFSSDRISPIKTSTPKASGKLPEISPNPVLNACGKTNASTCLSCGVPELGLLTYMPGRRATIAEKIDPSSSKTYVKAACDRKGNSDPNCADCGSPAMEIKAYTPKERPTFAEMTMVGGPSDGSIPNADQTNRSIAIHDQTTLPLPNGSGGDNCIREMFPQYHLNPPHPNMRNSEVQHGLSRIRRYL